MCLISSNVFKTKFKLDDGRWRLTSLASKVITELFDLKKFREMEMSLILMD